MTWVRQVVTVGYPAGTDVGPVGSWTTLVMEPTRTRKWKFLGINFNGSNSVVPVSMTWQWEVDLDHADDDIVKDGGGNPLYTTNGTVVEITGGSGGYPNPDEFDSRTFPAYTDTGSNFTFMRIRRGVILVHSSGWAEASEIPE